MVVFILLKTKQKMVIKPNIQRFDASLWGAIEPNKSIQGVSISWNEISPFRTKLNNSHFLSTQLTVRKDIRYLYATGPLLNWGGGNFGLSKTGIPCLPQFIVSPISHYTECR